MAAGRRYTYSGRIKISREDMKLFLAGRKKCTIRMGTVHVATETISLTDGRKSAEVRITKVDTARRFGELTDQDARDEGFTIRTELIDDLRYYYPRAADDDPISVIYFEPVVTDLRLL